MTSRRIVKISFPILVLVSIYFLGPQPATPTYDPTLPEVPSDARALEEYVTTKDKGHHIKPNNEGRILWNDSAKNKTEYAVVYMHGFSASQMEGDPVHRRFAKEFGCNLYLPRLADHGIDTTEQLLFYTADRAWQSAKDALAIGRQLGNKVIVMGTSSGATLALMLAARYPKDVYALINLSPNIEINNPAAFIINNPWGLLVARMVMHGKYRVTNSTEENSKYWNNRYRLEAAVQLQQILEDNMTAETFSKIKQPSLTLYYYKNEQEQDSEVRVSAMLEMNKRLGTTDSLKEAIAMPDAAAHVLANPLKSKDVDGVYREIEKFALEKLKLVKS